MRAYAEEVAQQREQKTWIEKMMYQYPIGINLGRELPEYLKLKLNDSPNLDIRFRFEHSAVNSIYLNFNYN